MDETSGEQSFTARARIMILLGEQLITDEVAAVSELIKNAYDAEAPEVTIELKNVSNKDQGEITIIDKGHGMTKDTLLSSWLELGTLSKIRKKDQPARRSESGERICLGEKGLGRLAVHKIGKHTEITTRRKDTQTETKLILDWTIFEDSDKFLEDIKNNWKTGPPIEFTKDSPPGYEQGTKIHITKLQRAWTSDMIKRLKTFVWTIQSPLSDLKDFNVILKVDDPEDVEIKFKETKELLDTAHYVFIANINEDGKADITYTFKSPIYQSVNREIKFKNEDLRQAPIFTDKKKPTCGPFKLVIHCWELDAEHKKKTFGDGDVYNVMVKPQTGMRVIRDGFRVFPYGSPDNDWLNMDQQRIERFQFNVSRNQLIGYAEISADNNKLLIDKSDREGLIDNQAYREFRHLISSAILFFQTKREEDRDKIKKIKKLDPRTNRFSDHLKKLNKVLEKEKITSDTQKKISDLVENTIKIFDETLEEVEEPLLGAASIGLTYMIPTHELRRTVKESIKILKKLIKSDGKEYIESARLAIEQLNESEEIIRGLVQIAEKVEDKEQFKLKLPVERSIELMQKKLERNNVKITLEVHKDVEVNSTRRAIIIMLLNMIENSIYWLGNNEKDKKEIKLVIDEFDKNNVLVISDNGPGIQDSLEMITKPFYTTKVGGMGLGLFICNKTAENNGLRLKLLSKDDLPGLLPGANIGILFPKDEAV